MEYNTQQYGQNPNYQQPNYPQQPNQYRQPQYGSPRPMGPPIGQIITQSSLAKLGLVLIILAVIGLIISFAVPWAMIDWKDCSLDDDEKSFGHDFENSEGNHFASLPIAGIDSVGTGGNTDDMEDYLEGIPGLVDIGFVFFIILGIVSIILGVIIAYQKNRYQNFLTLTKLIIGVTSLFPAIWITTSGFKLVGININTALNSEALKDVLAEDLSIWFPAGYIVLIFGLIFLILTLILIKTALSNRNLSGIYFFDKIIGGEKR